MSKTKVIKINCNKPEEEKIKEAARVIKKGGIVALPTDTVYGLAVDALNKEALARLSKIKKRPQNKPFSLLISDTKILELFSLKVSSLAKKYIARFWPGALTVILENKLGEKIGLRFPKHRIVQDLIRACQVPLACPSANFSGERPCVDAKSVKQKFAGEIEMIINGGKAALGKESSVIDLSVRPPRILREGAISKKELNSLLVD